jgi:hypothetical protein
VVTGDLWHQVPATGTVAVRVQSIDVGRRNGIAIAVPGGSIAEAGRPAVNEMLVWPTASSAEYVFTYEAPRGTIGVCNIYMSETGGSPRVDRWSENAGMVVSVESEHERSYACNHASSRPPRFGDILFRLDIS